MVPSAWQFGPFASGIGPIERVARLRAMRAIVTLHTGPRGLAACRALHLAEADPDANGLAILALDRLDPLDRRHVLSTYHRVAQVP